MTLTARLPRRGHAVARWANDHRKWLFAAPAITFVVGLVAIPVVYTLYLSFTDASMSLRADHSVIGIDNYLRVLTDTNRFWPAVGRTIYFTIGAVSIELLLGLAIALLLRRPFRGDKVVRVIILLPLVATPVAVGMMWRLIFEPTMGFANQFLGWFGIPPQGWITDPNTALNTLMFVDIWQWTPMMVLILLAGLTTLPQEPDEAARVDGASAFQRFRYVTLPLLMPTLIAAVLLRTIDAVKTFDILYATKGMTGGSLHEVETLNINAYALNFAYNEYGLASTTLVLFLVLVLVFVGVLMIKKREEKSQ